MAKGWADGQSARKVPISVLRDLAAVAVNLGQLKATCSTDTRAKPGAGAEALPAAMLCCMPSLAAATGPPVAHAPTASWRQAAGLADTCN